MSRSCLSHIFAPFEIFRAEGYSDLRQRSIITRIWNNSSADGVSVVFGVSLGSDNYERIVISKDHYVPRPGRPSPLNLQGSRYVFSSADD